MAKQWKERLDCSQKELGLKPGSAFYQPCVRPHLSVILLHRIVRRNGDCIEPYRHRYTHTYMHTHAHKIANMYWALTLCPSTVLYMHVAHPAVWSPRSHFSLAPSHHSSLVVRGDRIWPSSGQWGLHRTLLGVIERAFAFLMKQDCEVGTAFPSPHLPALNLEVKVGHRSHFVIDGKTKGAPLLCQKVTTYLFKSLLVIACS